MSYQLPLSGTEFKPLEFLTSLTIRMGFVLSSLGIEVKETVMTAILQLLVFVASAFAFAWYVLRRDKREHAGPNDSQQSIYLPEKHPDDNPDRRGAAMSQL